MTYQQIRPYILVALACAVACVAVVVMANYRNLRDDGGGSAAASASSAPPSPMSRSSSSVAPLPSSRPPAQSSAAAAQAASVGLATPPAPAAKSATSFITCAPTSLTVGSIVGVAQAGLDGRIIFTNQGSEPCTLAGHAVVQVQDASGAAQPVAVQNVGSSKTPVTVEAGASVREAFVWTNWCDDLQDGPFFLKVSFPGRDGYLIAPLLMQSGPPSSPPPCDDRTEGSVLRLQAFGA